MKINELLKELSDNDGSDLYLSTGAPPSAKFSGKLRQLTDRPYEDGEILDIANSLMDEDQRAEFETSLEMNLAIELDEIGRFRINIFKQRNEISIVARNIVTEIPNVDDLGLPDVLKDVITAKNGLVLFVGGTGSGKSTSLAALIDHRNRNSSGHIITIEDPVEYVHPHKKCIVNQREVGVDTLSFHHALKNTLRQAPDVILIGEIRDRETMEHALAFAETGHLAISTLHANNANQALDRIINFFPEERRGQLLHDLGNNIKAFVSQRLVATTDGKRCAAIEILLGSHTIKQAIMKGQLSDIKEIMQKSENSGMMTFDSALFELAKAGKITVEEAIKNADSANNLRLRLKLSSKGGGGERKGQDQREPDADAIEDDAADAEIAKNGTPEQKLARAKAIIAKKKAAEALRKKAAEKPAANDSKLDLEDEDDGLQLSLEPDAEPEPTPEEEANKPDAPQEGMDGMLR